MATFREENAPLVEMVREWHQIREHNLAFKNGDDLSTALMFAEGALVCMICEHFVRMVLEKNAPGSTEGKQLRGMLDTSIKAGLFELRHFKGRQEEGKEAVCNHRNALLHGNFAQAAKQSGCKTVAEYFLKRYAPEMEAMTKIMDDLMQQIDARTGKPIPRRPSAAKKKQQRKARRK